MARKREVRRHLSGPMKIFLSVLLIGGILAFAYALYRIWGDENSKEYLRDLFEENKEVISELISGFSR